MPLEEITRMLQARVWTPFRVHVTDGVSYDVLERWQVLPLARSIIIGFPAHNLPSQVAGDWVNITLIHITRIEPIMPTPTAGNGLVE
jgi:hypothetical protein